MPFDFKKEYKEYYLPPAKPVIVTVPKANYIAVRGKSLEKGSKNVVKLWPNLGNSKIKTL